MKIGSQVYVKGSAEAVALYQRAFGVTLGYHVLNEDGSFFHSELMSDEDFFLAVSEATTTVPEGYAPPEHYGRLLSDLERSKAVGRAGIIPTMQFGAEFPDESGVLNAFEVLKPGAQITMPVGRLPWSDCCASLIDKFGVNWYLTGPQHPPVD